MIDISTLSLHISKNAKIQAKSRYLISKYLKYEDSLITFFNITECFIPDYLQFLYVSTLLRKTSYTKPLSVALTPMSASGKDINQIAAAPDKWLGVRHIQILMIFLGMVQTHCARTTMSLAIVDMTDPTNENYFDWTIQRQSVVLSSFNWGYIVPQLISGVLVEKFGGMTFMTICVGVNSFVSLILPTAAIYGGWVTICVCRGFQGMAQGTIFPTITYLLAKWVPVNERGRLVGFVLSGSYLGIASQMLISGYIANYWGWPTIFYVNGVAGAIWTVIYLLIGSDNPQVSKLISTEERLYIQSSLGQIGGHKKYEIPWKSVLSSMPFYAVIIANVGYTWGYWTLLTEIPTYLSKAMQVNIRSNGVLSALPYLTIFAMNFPVGFTSDFMIRKKWVSLTACRKIFNSFAFFGAAISLLCITYIPARSVTLAVLSLCVALGFSSGFYSGYTIALLDMAQNFSSVIMGISSFTANFSALFAPLLVGFVVKDETDAEEWHTIFYVSATMYVITNVIFLLFGTSKEQKWNVGKEISNETIKA